MSAPDAAPPRSDRVVVVGNGPVGQTTALLLAHWGVPSLVLDSRPERDVAGSRAICQQRDVIDVWDTVGAGRQIAAEGLTWVRARTYYRDQELFCIEFAEQGAPAFPPFVNLSQSRTEELLDERIVKQPLIETRWGTVVSQISQTDDTVTVTADDGTGARGIPAPFVVLAAGARSQPLRSQLGVDFHGRSFEDQFLICDVRCELPGWEQERRFYFDPAWNPGRQVLIHPCPGSTYRIDWQVPPHLDLDEEERTGGLDRRIRQIVGDRPYEVVWRSLYRFHARLADRMQVGRVLLAGDCAHLMAPFGARGLNSGVADAENAAWKLAWALRGWAGPELLRSYHEERHAAARENLAVTAATMEFLVPQSEAGHRRRRELLEAALVDPAVRSRVDSGRLSEPYWYVDSPLTTADPTREPAGRPPKGLVPPPGVGVLLPDVPVTDPRSGERTRLRLLARSGALVLANGSRPPVAELGASLRDLGLPVLCAAMEVLGATPTLESVLEARAGEVWVVRPDAHVAAVVPDGEPGAVRAALRRMAGWAPER